MDKYKHLPRSSASEVFSRFRVIIMELIILSNVEIQFKQWSLYEVVNFSVIIMALPL